MNIVGRFAEVNVAGFLSTRHAIIDLSHISAVVQNESNQAVIFVDGGQIETIEKYEHVVDCWQKNFVPTL